MSLRRTTPLRFVPTGESAWRFAVAGRLLLWSAMTAVSRGGPDSSPEARCRLQQRWSARILRHLAVDLRIEHDGPLPRSPHIIVALHEGMLDPLCLLQLGVPMRFVARREIGDWPGIGPAVTAMQHIMIDPERGLRAWRRLREQAAAAIGCGEHVVIFAQGTVLGIEAAFRRGAFELAASLGCGLLPIAIAGTHRVWEHPFSPTVRYAQPVWMRVMAPVAAPSRAPEAIDGLRCALQATIKDLALEQPHAPPRRYLPARDGYWDGFAFEIDPRFAALQADITTHRARLTAA